MTRWARDALLDGMALRVTRRLVAWRPA